MPNFSINTKVIVQVGLIPDLGIFSDITEVIVDTSVYLPGMCTITFAERVPEGSPVLEHVDNMLKYKIGEKVIVSVLTEDISMPSVPLKILFTGEITAIEPIFEKGGKILLRIRAFDKGHRLTQGKKFQTFTMMTDALIVAKIVGAAGLVPKITPTRLNTLNTQVIQYDQSDWDFLWDRAQLYGYQMYVDNLGIFHFEPAGGFNGEASLAWGENLVQFEPRLVSMGQVTTSYVGGWDPKIKMPIVGMSPGAASIPTSVIGNLLTGPVTEAMAFGQKKDYLVDAPMGNIAQANLAAQGLMDEHATQFVRASGEVITCVPNLVAGAKVTIRNVGVRFAGLYYVTEAKHIYRDGDYRILFQVSGQNPSTIRHLINGDDGSHNKIQGVVVGLVTNLKDPLMMGRVKVKFPWIPMEEIESDWARVVSIGAGSAGGLMFLPELNDEVLVAFEHGDINFPYIVGMLWNGKDRPPSMAAVGPDGKVAQRIIRSRSGHMITLDDSAGREQVIIEDKTKGNSIVIDSVKNAMTIKARGDLAIEAGGKLTLNGMMMEMKATQGAKIDAASGQSVVDLQTAGTTIKGMKVDVQATTQANIQANAQVSIKANAQVSVEGTAMVQVQGGLVKIN